VSTSAPRSPGRPRSAEADAAIVRATLDVLLAEGFRGLSVEAVRQRAGVGKATIYRRFPDKQALVRAAIASVHADLQPPDTGSLLGDLDVLWENSYAGASFAPRLLADAADDPEMHRIFREALIDPRRAMMTTILERAVARGELRDDLDLDIVVPALAGIVLHRVFIFGEQPDTALIERVIDQIILPAVRPAQA
jgi:AcrR family transcriptional regulator